MLAFVRRVINPLISNSKHTKDWGAIRYAFSKSLIINDVNVKHHITTKPKCKFAPRDFSHIVEGLRLFKQQYGHLVVSTTFAVPRKDSSEIDWPKEMEGYPLGQRLRSIMDNDVHRTKNRLILNSLSRLGVPLTMRYRSFVWEYQALPAFQTFQQIYGHVSVPSSFVVPTNDNRWPRSTWGVKLGDRTRNIRRRREKCTEEELHDLAQLNFVWRSIEYRWTEVILPALKFYVKQHGNCAVPRSFVVPMEEPWPQSLWGVRLGLIVASIRVGRYADLNITADLDALGFIWKSVEYTWSKRVVPALAMFREIHKDATRVPSKFIVPSESPWPEIFWGMKLGDTVQRIRNLNHFKRELERDMQNLQDKELLGLLGLKSENNTTQ